MCLTVDEQDGSGDQMQGWCCPGMALEPLALQCFNLDFDSCTVFVAKKLCPQGFQGWIEVIILHGPLNFV